MKNEAAERIINFLNNADDEKVNEVIEFIWFMTGEFEDEVRDGYIDMVRDGKDVSDHAFNTTHFLITLIEGEERDDYMHSPEWYIKNKHLIRN